MKIQDSMSKIQAVILQKAHKMECAGMQAACDFRGTEFFQFFYAGDNLDHSSCEPRSISGGTRLDDKTKIMMLAFELGLRIMESNNV